MKYVFFSFQGINMHNKPEGMVRIVLPIFEKLNLPKIYYMRYNDGTKRENIVIPDKLFTFISKVIRKILSYLRNIGLSRLVDEFMLDLYYSFKIKDACILVSSTICPITAKKNKKKGGTNILIAGNPYDRAIKEVLLEEAKKYNTIIRDAYTFEPRLKYIDKALKYQDYILVQTEVTKQSFVEYNFNNVYLNEYHLLFPFEKKNIIFNQRKKIKFFSLAHNVWLKGIIYLVKAWNVLDCDAELTIGGFIDTTLQKEIDKINNKDINFLGNIDFNLKDNYYVENDVFIVTSLYDDHPATIFEAFMNGLPVIATNRCGSSSLIKDYYNGFVIPVANEQLLAEKMKWFIENIDLLKEMKKNALETVKNFNYEKQNINFLNNLLKLTGKL